MKNKNILDAIKTISEYCTSKECENCKIESICDEISIMPCYWNSRIKTIEERIAKNEKRNK
jgi:hypothetical protein